MLQFLLLLLCELQFLDPHFKIFSSWIHPLFSQVSFNLSTLLSFQLQVVKLWSHEVYIYFSQHVSKKLYEFKSLTTSSFYSNSSLPANSKFITSLIGVVALVGLPKVVSAVFTSLFRVCLSFNLDYLISFSFLNST